MRGPPPATTAVTVHVLAPLPDAIRELAPLEAFERLRHLPCPWLLDSALRRGALGRYSFLGADPYAVLRVRGPLVETLCLRDAHPGLPPGRQLLTAPALETLRALLPTSPDADGCDLPFIGGAVGYLGYELAEQLDRHALHGRDDLGLPDVVMLLVDGLVAFDHATGRRFVSALGFGPDAGVARERARARAREVAATLGRAQVTPPPGRARAASGAPAPTHVDVSPAEHRKAVDTIGDEIAAGNVYQACLTGRWDRAFSGDPWSLYRALRRVNPAPFAAYLELPEVAIASSSPERFLRIDRDRRVESRPIKGTAARGRHPDEDARSRAALRASAKDRAENLMIVDLVRNDLGRVCETGSVSVPSLAAVETYATVFQMVSSVRGILLPDRDALDAVAATFPPGSMTGAPKIAAMQLLDRLETLRRGVYSGAVGYLDARGGADLSVVIRTLLVRQGRVHLHAGGGIVADSRADAEWREVTDKLRPLLAALELCAEEPGV